MMENSIGGFQFIQLAGAIRLPTQAIMVLTRAGVDGVTLVDDGNRGQPFVLRSMVDAADLAVAVDEYANYAASVGGRDDGDQADVAMILNDVDVGSYAKLHVLDVNLVECRPLRGATGGLNPPSDAWLVADWTLLASAYDEGVDP